MLFQNKIINKILNFLVILFFLIIIIIPLSFIFFQAIFSNNYNLNIFYFLIIFKKEYIILFLNTILYSTSITVITVLCGIYISYIILDVKYKKVIIYLIIITLFLNILLKIHVFINLFGTYGTINNILHIIGLHIDLLFTLKGYIFISVYIFLPIVILQLYFSMNKINKNIIYAATDLGASDFHIIYKIIFPSIKKSIYSCVQLIFIPSISLFMINGIITGNKIVTLSTVIEEQFLKSFNWQLGAILSIVLIFISYLGLYLSKKILNVGSNK